MSFKLRFKGLNKVTLFNVSREVIPEKWGTIGKGQTGMKGQAQIIFPGGHKVELKLS